MAANIIPGAGTLFQISIASVYTTVGQRVTITGPSIEVNNADTTHLDSATVTNRPTLADGGEVSLQIFFDPTDTVSHQTLAGLASTKLITNFKLIFAVTGPNNTYTFAGFLTKYEVSGMEWSANLTADITIKVNGLPVLT